MITKKNKDLAQWAMEYALKNGCQQARVNLYNGSESSYEIRDMKIDRLQSASENSLSIQLYVDGKFGSYSTNRLKKDELESLIKNGIESTRYLMEDLARTLPDASRYYKGGGADLQLYDPNFLKIDPDLKVNIAKRICDEAMGKDERIISVSTGYSEQDSFRYMVASNGFEGETSGSYYSVNASVSIKGEGDARPSDGWYDLSLYFDELKKEGIGKTALERVLRKIGQKKIASAKIPMLLDNRNSSRMISPLIAAINGGAIQQKSSFLLDKLNQKVVGENFTLIDEPHMIKAQGARYFDGEGVATKRMPIFENGVLKTYLIDTYNAHKLEVEPTISSPSILTVPLGTKDLNGLIASLDKAIYVTAFNGGNTNSTTGDFSFGIEGFLIENGKVTQPISEMNITGNVLTLMNNLLEIGNDPQTNSSWRLPSMLFDAVDFTGI